MMRISGVWLGCRSLALLATIGPIITACSRQEGNRPVPPGPPAPMESTQVRGTRADSADMRDMPGMPGVAQAPPLATAVALSAAQVLHGNVRWAPAEADDPTGPASASLGLLPGQLTPNEDRTARLGAPGRGRVLVVRVSPGDRVSRGQILVTLQSAEAATAQSDLSKAAAAVASKRAQATYAKAAHQRAERLLTLKAIPQQDYERAIADDQLAQTELGQADAELERARLTATALGATESANGELALRAPLAGIVLERSAAPGAVVEAGAPLVVVTDLANLWLTIEAPEAAIGVLRIGSSLRFTVPAYPADTFGARLTAVGAGLDPVRRTLSARAVVANGLGKLRPAMLATVEVLTSNHPPSQGGTTGAVVLPADAVQLVRGIPTVFLAAPDGKGGAQFTGRRVDTGARMGNRVMVLRGIRLGERVVIQGAFAVKAALEKGAMPKMEM